MVTRALTKTLHLHEHFEHTHSVQNLKSNPRFLTASAVSVERRSLESLVIFKVSHGISVRSDPWTWWIFRGSKADRVLVAMWAKRRFSRLGTTTGFEVLPKKKTKGRNEVWFCSYAPCPWLPSNPCAPNPWRQRGTVETWKPCCCAYFRLCLGSFRLARHSPPKRMRNIEKIQRCCSSNCSRPEIHLQINKYLQISTKSTVTALSQRPEGVKRRQEHKPWWTTQFC